MEDNQNFQKKLHPKIVVAIIVVLIVISGFGVAYAFKDTLINSYHLNTKSPIEYYAYLEKSRLNAVSKEIATNTAAPNEDYAYDISTDVTFNKEALNSVMQSALGTSFTDMEGLLGVTIDSIGMNMLVGIHDSTLSETLALQLNQTNLITLEAFIDYMNQQMFFRFPELSNAYLSKSMSEPGSGAALTKDQLDLFSSDNMSEMLRRYGNLIIDHITNATLDKNFVLSLETLSTDCNKLTITITWEDAINITTAVLEEAKTDSTILSLLPMMGLTEVEYLQSIEEAKANLADVSKENSGIEDMQMLLYVDSKGNILSREFTSANSSSALGYTLLSNDNYDEYKLYVKDDAGNLLLNAYGNQTHKNGIYNGDLTLDVSIPEATVMQEVSLEVAYEEVHKEYKNGRFLQYGTYTLSSLDLMGLQIISKNSVSEDVQYNKTTLQLGASSLVTIDTTITPLADYPSRKPADDAIIYDEAQMEEYNASIDINAYLNYLSDAFGIDVQMLYELFANSL